MARNYVFAQGEYYHLYARGFEKSTTFRDQADNDRFVESLYLLNSANSQNIRDARKQVEILGLTSVWEIERGDALVDIGAYCLMPNHFHILVKEIDEDGKGVSRFMQKLMTSYTMYFNKRYDRTGSLFSSSFKAKHITDDNHLKYLFAYIHLNPLELKNKKLEKYKHSSYLDYLKDNRPENKILSKTAFPNYFNGNLKEEIDSWLKIRTEV